MSDSSSASHPFTGKGVVFPPLGKHPYLTLLGEALREEGVPILDFYQYKTKNLPHLLLQFILKRSQATILHLHWIEYQIRAKSYLKTLILGSYLLFTLLFLRVFLRYKIVITLHNVIPHEWRYSRLEYGFLRNVIKLSHALIVHSHQAQEQAIQVYPTNVKKIHVIPHGTFTTIYPKPVEQTFARKQLKLPDTAFIIGVFGSIRPYKNIHFLIDCLKALDVKEPTLHLVIAGPAPSPEYLDRVNNAAKQKSWIQIVPKYIPDKQLPLYYAAADLIAFPYSRITTSGATFLAIGLGRTLLLPRLSVFLETIPQKYAFWYDTDNSQSCISSIKHALTKHSQLAKSDVERIKWIKTHYGWQPIAKTTKTLYNTLNAEG